MNIRAAAMVLAVAIAPGLVSCAAHAPTPLSPEEAKRFSFDPARIPEAQRTRAARSNPETLAIKVFERLQSERKYREALNVLRDELIDPIVYDEGYSADIAGIYIKTLSDLLDYEAGERTRFDAEMKRVYRFANEMSAHDLLRQVQVETSVALYYSSTKRNGLALPHMRRSLEIYTKIKDPYQIINQHNSMAAAFNDMGEEVIGGRFRDRALELAESYFKIGISPLSSNEWLQYHKMIKLRMDSLAGDRRSLAVLAKLWKRYEQIMLHYKITPMSDSYKQAGIYFIMSGDQKRGQELFDQGEQISKTELQTLSGKRLREHEIDVYCKRLSYLAVLKRYQEALSWGEKCWDGFVSLKRDMGIAIPSIYGNVLEGVGRYRAAADKYLTSINDLELGRGAFEVGERARFFSNVVARRPYWGLVRSRAGLAVDTPTAEALFDVVRASERMHARQFADRMELADEKMLGNASLSRFRKRLGRGVAVVSYVLTDSSVVIAAMTRNRHRVVMKEYDKARFDGLVRRIAGELATPDSGLLRLQRDLVEASEVLIAPLGDMVSQAERIVVVPDGIMSVLPYAILSASGRQYRPIIERSSVTMSPSFRQMLTHSERAEPAGEPRLFAVADPKFEAEYEVAGLSRTLLRDIGVNSSFQQYFAPLPETKDEVVAISRLFQAGRADILSGAAASESAVKRRNLSSYRYLHFATHGVVGSDLPGLSEPALVFAKDATNDGFLTSSEAQKFDLSAELTVLSACKTGAGEVVAGEGVMGMGRAFLLAGSRGVIMSLWSVASKETEILMVDFYRTLSRGKLSVSRAFRAASLSLRKSRPHPFYWAPFIVVGAELSAGT